MYLQNKRLHKAAAKKCPLHLVVGGVIRCDCLSLSTTTTTVRTLSLTNTRADRTVERPEREDVRRDLETEKQ